MHPRLAATLALALLPAGCQHHQNMAPTLAAATYLTTLNQPRPTPPPPDDGAGRPQTAGAVVLPAQPPTTPAQQPMCTGPACQPQPAYHPRPMPRPLFRRRRR